MNTPLVEKGLINVGRTIVLFLLWIEIEIGAKEVLHCSARYNTR